LLQALERDPRLTQGQKETVGSVYRRFVASALLPTRPSTEHHLTVQQVLDIDPRLTRGQREALRTMLSSFSPKGS
jgi:hypothetical protein